MTTNAKGMKPSEFEKYVKLIMSMSTDYLMGGLSQKTYISNLIMISKQLDLQHEAKGKV